MATSHNLITSQAFGLALQAEFLRLSANTKFKEVPLFRRLMEAIASSSGGVYAEEFHGAKHQVTFVGQAPWARSQARCELCDLLIIVYALTGGFKGRVTFLQAKRSLGNHHVSTQPPLSIVPAVRFQANLEQWDLLSRRPIISPVGSFVIPSNILKDAPLPSIGSFGVFHKTTGNGVDFFYISADLLTAAHNSSYRYGTVEANGFQAKANVFGISETKFAGSLSLFGEALFNLEIGTPIYLKKHAKFDDYQKLLQGSLKGALVATVSRSRSDGSVMHELINSLEGDANPWDSQLAPNILVIRTDFN